MGTPPKRVQKQQTKDNRKAAVMLAIAGLLASYALGSKALDSGSWWHYLATAMALYFTIQFAKQALARHGR